MKNYFRKWKGEESRRSPGFDGYANVFWSWLGSFIGIGLCGWLSSFYFEGADMTLIIGSFGATVVLLNSAIMSPLAQPRNCVGGHIISGLVGVLCFKIFGDITWLASALAVSLAIVAMLLTGTLHPPGGATALIAVIGSDTIHNLGYLYALIPAGLGASILLLVALVVNNLTHKRSYPLYWW